MAEEVKSDGFNQNFRYALSKWIERCPSCGGYGQKPPLPLDYIGSDDRCAVCSPVREFFFENFKIEFLCYT